MSFEINKREREGIVILDLKGRLVVGEAASKLREEMIALAAAGQHRVVLNLRGVDFIDSTGLGAMVIVAPAGRAALRRDGRSSPRAPKSPGAGSQRGTGRAPGPAAPSAGSA